MNFLFGVLVFIVMLINVGKTLTGGNDKWCE